MQGFFEFSQNINAFELYTGTINAILSNGKRNSWYHSSLNNASCWLKENNKYFYPYIYYYNRGNILGPLLIIPTATIVLDEDDLNNSSQMNNINTNKSISP